MNSQVSFAEQTLRDVPRHAVQFYETEEFLYDLVSNFLAAGLRDGGPLIVVATERNREAFCNKLEAEGISVRRAVGSGQLTLLDAHETLAAFMVNGLPDPRLFHEHVGGVVARTIGEWPHARLRAYGEMVDVLWRDGKPEAAAQLEALWNHLAEEQPLSLLCAYTMDTFSTSSSVEGFERICSAHSHVGPSEGVLRHGDAQNRELARMKQRARALENEINLRKKGERALRDALAQRDCREAELRDNREALRQQNEKLAAALSAKDEFLAILGHELRNPLAPMVTALELVRARGGETREHLVLDRQVRHLMRLVDDLLDVSRITRGEVELKMESVDFAAAVAAAVEATAPLFQQRRHRVTLAVPAREIVVFGDECRLTQIVSNLLSNAAKYTPDGGAIRLSVTVDASKVTLRVRDTGIGMAADLLPRVFNLFVQADRTLDRSAGGLGLGLTIVRSLVEVHHGTVEARSEGPGQGSEFVVQLPLGGAAVVPAFPAPEIPSATEHIVGLRVLVVDDNVNAAELITEALLQSGYVARAVHDAASALEIAGSFKPDALLLDIGLPGMDGYELARRLRALPETASSKLVALTGYGQESDRADAVAAGFHAHLVKPVELVDLENTLQRLLQKTTEP